MLLRNSELRYRTSALSFPIYICVYIPLVRLLLDLYGETGEITSTGRAARVSFAYLDEPLTIVFIR